MTALTAQPRSALANRQRGQPRPNGNRQAPRPPGPQAACAHGPHGSTGGRGARRVVVHTSTSDRAQRIEIGSRYGLGARGRSVDPYEGALRAAPGRGGPGASGAARERFGSLIRDEWQWGCLDSWAGWRGRVRRGGGGPGQARPGQRASAGTARHRKVGPQPRMLQRSISEPDTPPPPQAAFETLFHLITTVAPHAHPTRITPPLPESDSPRPVRFSSCPPAWGPTKGPVPAWLRA